MSSVVSVMLRRRRVVAVAVVVLALDLVLDRVGDRNTGCTAQERLEFAAVAHLVADGATGTSADDGGHEALLAILALTWLAVVVGL